MKFIPSNDPSAISIVIKTSTSVYRMKKNLIWPHFYWLVFSKVVIFFRYSYTIEVLRDLWYSLYSCSNHQSLLSSHQFSKHFQNRFSFPNKINSWNSLCPFLTGMFSQILLNPEDKGPRPDNYPQCFSELSCALLCISQQPFCKQL